VALEAKRLLAESDVPVAEIGAQLGFGEATNFGRFFARTVGCAPGVFRAQSRAASMELEPATSAPVQPLAVALSKAGAGRGDGPLPVIPDLGDRGLTTRVRGRDRRS